MTVPRIIAGRYELDAGVGGGGMGTVHRARDLRLDRTVVVKLPHRLPELDTPQYRQRFEIEAKAAARLEHDHVVRVYDYGDDGGQLYLVMEFVRGDTLAALIERRAPLALPQKLQLLSQLSSALDAIHGAGIVHRDVKPLNLMVADDLSRLKVVDFGLAKISTGSMPSIFAGTPQYMSPEQFDADARVDNRTDLFSFGLVAYELLTSRRAAGVKGGTPWQLRTDPPLPLVELDAGPRDVLQPLVLRCLERDPERRYQNAREVFEVLGRVDCRPMVDVATETPTVIQPVAEKAVASRSRSWLIAGAIAVVVALLATVAAVSWQNDARSAASSSPQPAPIQAPSGSTSPAPPRSANSEPTKPPETSAAIRPAPVTSAPRRFNPKPKPK